MAGGRGGGRGVGRAGEGTEGDDERGLGAEGVEAGAGLAEEEEGTEPRAADEGAEEVAVDRDRRGVAGSHVDAQVPAPEAAD